MNSKPFLPLVLLLLLTLPGCYLLEQGKGQMDLRFSQVSIEEAIEKEKNPEFKKLLASVPDVKRFAVEKVLLEPTVNYDGYYHTEQRGITFVVTAARKDQLAPHTWWFPIIGSVPYKGYFNERKALELQRELEEEGLDTWLFAAPAYSTLGWFKDPITTPMLRYGAFSLTDTVIHEMTHVTLYVNGQGDFNEQLATFVGQKGAELYFQEKGELSEEKLDSIKADKKRRVRRSLLIQSYIPKLEELYKQDLPFKETLKQRTAIFKQLTDELLRLHPKTSREQWQFNNARILQYRRYKPEAPLFRETWEKSNRDWKKFWKLIQQYVEDQGWET